MLGKLAFRNAKRSMKDYLVYLITMTCIASLMFAFNFMIFSKEVKNMCQDATVMVAMLGLVTFFIIIIVSWLINYMVKFMLEKRSREFGTYMLLGMEKKSISRLYMRENVLVGLVGFVIGIFGGLLLQQVLLSIFFNVFGQSYQIKINVNIWSVLMTIACYFGCFFLALFRNKRKFKKMTISDFMRMDKENEKVKEGNIFIRQCMFFAAVIYFIVFFALMLRGNYKVGSTILMIIGFIAAIYLIYIGFAAFIVRHIKKGSNNVYRGQNLFLYRQMSSKLRTMRFTMGTLTILLTCSLLGGSVAMMFGKFQNTALNDMMPFDVLVYSNKPEDTFDEERAAIQKNGGIKEEFVYKIYQNGTTDMNDRLYTHGYTIGDKYKNKDGSIDRDAVAKDGYEYYDYDTFISLSDYNKLREMLGYEKISLEGDHYALQIKSRLKKCMDKNTKIQSGNHTLTLSNFYTDSFCQNGINGADYIIVVPDQIIAGMKEYYSNFAVSTMNDPTDKLQDTLQDIRLKKNGIMPEKEFDKLVDQGKIDEDELWDDCTLGGQGTDEIVVLSCDVMVSKALTREMKFVMTSITFPLAYVGFVFICVALTILAVQQISDSNKYKFRYDVLRKLGLSEHELDQLVKKQLLLFYMIPGILSVVLSATVALFAGKNFVKYTGVSENGFTYFGIAFVLFFGIYLVYFIATYVAFKRNIANERS